MRHVDTTIRTVGELVSALRLTTRADEIVWFRGHEDESWKLVPSLARPGVNTDAELTIIKRFKQGAAPYLPTRPVSEWEWIFLMQHHAAHTRLLDWSESPLVALYFALYQKKHEDKDAAVWCLDPVSLNQTSGHKRKFPKDILAFGIDPQLDEYLPEKVNARVSELFPVAAIGPRNSARMAAQAGTFTVMHVLATPVEEVNDGAHTWRFLIPHDGKQALRDELKLLGITEHTLFPDLDHVALLAREFAQ